MTITSKRYLHQKVFGVVNVVNLENEKIKSRIAKLEAEIENEKRAIIQAELMKKKQAEMVISALESELEVL